MLATDVRTWLPRICAALIVTIGVCLTPGVHAAPRARPPASAPAEIRALWVLRTSLATPEAIHTLVRSAREHGFNTLLVQVRGRGEAYYTSALEPRAAELQRQPDSFDPLATVLRDAHAAGLRVHAWVNVNFVSSASNLPSAREHIVHRHPDWLMVPREIAQELSNIPFESPAYLGKLARWTRAEAGEIEGLYASPIVPAAAEHLEAVVRDLARRYDVDGIHLDYARYPNDRFDYSRTAINEFRTAIRARVPEQARRAADAREAIDLFAYPDAFPDQWRGFRTSKLTALISRLRTAFRRERPAAIVSVAIAPDVHDALTHRLQDWRTWLESGLVDAICPMAYAVEPARFSEQIAAARDVAGGGAVWAGIGAYRLSPDQTIENIQAARRLGAAGVILFSYDSLIDPRQSAPDYLALVGRAAFSDTRADGGTSR